MNKFILLGYTSGILAVAHNEALTLADLPADLPKYIIDGRDDKTEITQAAGSEFYICYVNEDLNKWEYELLHNEKLVISFESVTERVWIDFMNF